jgi:hypothetical protein
MQQYDALAPHRWGFSSPSSTNILYVKSELWKLQLDNIKVYLNNGLNVDKVIGGKVVSHMEELNMV